jgi:hypothetical protein
MLQRITSTQNRLLQAFAKVMLKYVLGQACGRTRPNTRQSIKAINQLAVFCG